MTDVLDLDALRQTGARDARGRWQRGNLARLRHGRRVAPDHPALAALHDDRVQAIVADLGGTSQLSAVQMPLVSELARLQLVAEALGLDVLRLGPLTGKGRTRAAVTLWLQTTAMQLKLAERLGLERRAKPAGADLRAYAMEHGQ